jgi:hypothetical protein
LHGDLAQRPEIGRGDLALDNCAERSCDLGQARSWPGERRDREAHRVVVVMLDHEGFLAAFRVPGQRAVGEATAPGLVHGVHDPAWRPEPERADPEAKEQHGTRHCGRR